VEQARKLEGAIMSITLTSGFCMAPSGRKTERLRHARCCYNHLVGWIGIAVTRSLRERGLIMERADQGYEVTPAGISWFTFIRVDVLALKLNRYGLVRQ
jgi:hypothetical protein